MEKSEKIEGSVIYATKLQLKFFLAGVSALVKINNLKESDKLFWNTAYNLSTEVETKKESDDTYVIIPINIIFDSIVDLKNPDYPKRDSYIKFSRSSRNSRINNYETLGILRESKTTHSDIKIKSRGKIYNIVNPNLNQFEISETSNVVRSKRRNNNEKQFYESRHDSFLIKEINKIYSWAFATNYLDIVLAPDPLFPEKTITADLKLEEGTLRVSSSCFDDSRLMTPKDKIVAKYLQSAAVEYMWNNPKEFTGDSSVNRFMFNLKDCLTSTGTSDSGTARLELYMSILRVCDNKFDLDGSNCPNFMEDAGFIDNNNMPMSKARHSHLSMIGATEEYTSKEDATDNKKNTRDVPLYVTLSIPSMLYEPTRKALILASENKDFSIARPKLFLNNDMLNFKETSGYQDTLSDYLKSKVRYSNKMTTKLKTVLPRWLKANETQPASGVFQFFRSLDDCMLYYAGKAKSTRSHLKYERCTGYFSEFIFECKVVQKNITKQFVMLDYDVTFYHVYPEQSEKIKNHLKKINKERKDNPELFSEVLTSLSKKFDDWLVQTMTDEGMKAAGQVHEDNKKKRNKRHSGLMLSPSEY